MSTRLEISKVTERIGAVVDGVRLGGDLDAEVVARINAALLEHKVIGRVPTVTTKPCRKFVATRCVNFGI